MNPATAYAIAAAVEKKTGHPVCLQTTNEVYQWLREDGTGYGVVKTTDAPANVVAQKVYDTLKRPPPPPKKRNKDDE